MSGHPRSRTRRHETIIELVSAERLGSQEEIRARLAELGQEATQSTISRDLEELGLARVHDAQGVRYVVPGSPSSVPSLGALRRLLNDFALSWGGADGGGVVGNPPGGANVLAEGIDRARLAEVAGTIAGDNTILIIGPTGVDSAAIETALTNVTEASSDGR